MMVDLAGRRCLVVGGGRVAYRKVERAIESSLLRLIRTGDAAGVEKTVERLFEASLGSPNRSLRE